MASIFSAVNQFTKTNESRNITLTTLNMSSSSAPGSLMEKYVIILPSVIGVICVLGLFGNSLVIAVILMNQEMRTSMNILILSLAVADLLFLLLCAPLVAVNIAVMEWPFGDFACKISLYSMYVSLYASVYMLVMMSLYRYLVVVHPIRSRIWISVGRTWTAVAVLWILILCVNTPVIFHSTEYESQFALENISQCMFTWAIDGEVESSKTFDRWFVSFGYFIPLGIIFLMYGFMLKRLLSGVAPGEGDQSAKRMRINKRITRMVVVVVVVFALSWLPVHGIILWRLLDRTFFSPEDFASISSTVNCFAFSNSCINPVLYAFLSQNFQQRFRKFLCCCRSSSQTGH